MTLEQFKMLKAVAELGTLKAASEKIYKSQAAISKGIKQLEQSLGVTLFNRSEYRLSLTIEGERIYHLCVPILKSSTEIEALGKHFNQGNESHLTLAFSSSFDITTILPILQKVQQKFPQTNVILHQENLTGAIGNLNSGAADMAITPTLPSVLTDDRLEHFYLNTAQSVKVASPILLARHPNLTHATQLEDEYQIIIQDSGSGTKNTIHAAVDGQRRWFVNEIAYKKTLLINGMGWGGIPEFFVADSLKSGALEIIQLNDLKSVFPYKFHCIKIKDNLFGPVAQMIWQELKLLAEQFN